MTAGTLDSGFMFDVFVGLPLLALAIVAAIVWVWAGREIDHAIDELEAPELERRRQGRS